MEPEGRNMSARDKFLALVDHKITGRDHGLFRVPTREDRTMSGTWRELDDGRLLIHDHGGDNVHEIVAAVGLELSDLFPPSPAGHRPGKPERRPFPAVDVLRCVAFETLVVSAAAAALLAGEPFGPAERERLILAASRIQGALSAAGVNHG